MWIGDPTENLANLFEDKEAVYDVRTQTRITYRDLHRRAAHAATLLAERGVGRGDRVAILSKNRLEHLDVLFACARLGAIFVPLNWRLAAPELRFMLDDTTPRVLLFDDEHAFMAGQIMSGRDGQAIALDGVTASTAPDAPAHLDWTQGLAACVHQPAPAPVAVDMNDPWIILYTSGTTGRPKGALLPYRQVAMNAMNTVVALSLTAADRTVTYTPFFHTGALHVLTTPLLTVGGSIVLDDGFDADRCLDLTANEGCTLLFGVPTTFEMMARATRFADADLKTVRVALCGGAPCPTSLIETYANRGIKFKQGYGLTEVGPNCLNLREQDVDKKRGSAGRPNLHIAARVVDESGQVISGPGRGELQLGGPCVCAGYWQRPDATADALTEDGYFKTGDIVERDDEGYYSIVDRKKDMFISGGENVYPAEVEKALADHPNVRAAAVIGIPDSVWGEVGCAFLEPHTSTDDPSSLDAAALKGWLKQRLAGYKVPKRYVVVDELPRNPTGKVQKHRLEAPQ